MTDQGELQRQIRKEIDKYIDEKGELWGFDGGMKLVEKVLEAARKELWQAHKKSIIESDHIGKVIEKWFGSDSL